MQGPPEGAPRPVRSPGAGGSTTPGQVPRDGYCQFQGGPGSYFALLPEATFLGFHSHRGRVLILYRHRRPSMRLCSGR